MSTQEDHDGVVAALDQLCRRHVTEEQVRSLDEDGAFPHCALAALADAGWAAAAVPTRFGGGAADVSTLAVVHRTLARHSLAVGQAYFSLWVLGARLLARAGSSEQQDTWLPRLAAGEAKIAFALTEPGSGSDAAALRTRAESVEGGFRVSGQKVFISGALVADRIVTAVRTSSGGRKQEGISLLLIDPQAEGVRLAKISKIGLKPLDLCEVFLDEVFVADVDVIGAADQAWATMRPGLAEERIFLAALSVGAARDVLDRTVAYAQEREAFGSPIGSFQMIAEKLVRMRIEIDAADLLTERAAAAADAGADDAVALAAIAKVAATAAYVTSTRQGVQVFGGYGFTDDYPVSRHYRDAKYLEIGGGTTETQIIIVARSMGLL